MLTFPQFLRSKTIWTTIALFIFNGVQGVWHVVPDGTATEINLFLSGAIGVARVSNTTAK